MIEGAIGGLVIAFVIQAIFDIYSQDDDEMI